MQRVDGRQASQLRPVNIIPGFVKSAAGSCLIECGGTRVIVTASVENAVPPFLRGKGQGWLTAEYAMLPASTGQRKNRDGLKKDGRGVEISRLIGRSLRQAVDLNRLGERSITIDCDVLEADGGTRTAAITGGFVALCLAVDKLIKKGELLESPLKTQVAAVSCGLVEGQALLDLNYPEDSGADADMNFVMNRQEGLIEVQGTGEGAAFPDSALLELLSLGKKGIRELMAHQLEALGEAARLIAPPILVVASGNAHKLQEMRALLGSRFRVLGMQEAGFEGEVEENGQTFTENARIKAEAVRDATGLMTLADDSGLMVDALDGQPGVHSARFAGRHGDDAANNQKLLELMTGRKDRSARFVCALALAAHGEETRFFEGKCEGEITHAPRGEGGFGYDPLFEVENGKTFAQLEAEEKNSISHRSRAIAALLSGLA